VLVALRDLVPGEELSINYVGLRQPRLLRQAALMHYGFECVCDVCVYEKEKSEEIESLRE
jgi:hypothetical protein